MWYGFESATSPRSTFCPQMRGTLRPLVVSEFKLLLTLLSRCCSVLNGIIISFVNFVQSYDAVSRRHHNDHSDVCFFSSWTIATHCCTACDGLLQSVYSQYRTPLGVFPIRRKKIVLCIFNYILVRTFCYCNSEQSQLATFLVC